MGTKSLRVKKTNMHRQIQIKHCGSWRYIDVLRHETIGLCEKLNSIYIFFYLWYTAMSDCHNIRRVTRQPALAHIYVDIYVDPYVLRPIETVANEESTCIYLCARAGWRVTREVKNYLNTVQFLAQTDRFVS